MTSSHFTNARTVAAELANTLDEIGHVLTDYLDDDLSCAPYALSTAAKSLAKSIDEARDDCDMLQEVTCDYLQFVGLLRVSTLGLRAEIDRVAPGKEESAARLAVATLSGAISMAEVISQNLTSMVLAHSAAERTAGTNALGKTEGVTAEAAAV